MSIRGFGDKHRLDCNQIFGEIAFRKHLKENDGLV
jgi:hypothetical protein